MIEPFAVDVPRAQLDDLRDRLRRTRWPDTVVDAGWDYGVPLDWLQDVCRYWADDYDWPSRQQHLNAFPQFRTTIDGLPIHFLHVRSLHDEAFPVVITHGWPGSVVEFLKVLGPLTDPVTHGGSAGDAFHVVCPSLPGYGFSGRPTERGWDAERTARAWMELMARLGYDRYGAQGGDWGSTVSPLLALHDPEHCVALHINMPVAYPDSTDDLTDTERHALEDVDKYNRYDAGYLKQQSTRPQTLAYGLTDSPAGQAAWILEKFWSWTDCAGHPENVLSRDELLDNVMVYWLTATARSSAHMYYETLRYGRATLPHVHTPTGCSIFPKEIFRASRRWVEKRFNVVYWNDLDRGGHFAAFEQPTLFVDELRAFFRPFR